MRDVVCTAALKGTSARHGWHPQKLLRLTVEQKNERGISYSEKIRRTCFNLDSRRIQATITLVLKIREGKLFIIHYSYLLKKIITPLYRMFFVLKTEVIRVDYIFITYYLTLINFFFSNAATRAWKPGITLPRPRPSISSSFLLLGPCFCSYLQPSTPFFFPRRESQAAETCHETNVRDPWLFHRARNVADTIAVSFNDR